MTKAKTSFLEILNLRYLVPSDPTFKRICLHLIFGFLTAAVMSCLIWVLPNSNLESVPMIIIFNFLFVSITFPLNGGLVEKLSLLIAGNFIGLLCNLILSWLAKTTTGHLYDSFRAIYLILSPLANVIWIVSYWSMSLTILSRRSKKKQRGG